MASVTAFETVWNTTTTPKSINVTGCAIGDRLLVVGLGNKTATMTSVDTTNTAGTVDTWVDSFLENLVGSTSGWYSAATALATSTGTITVQMTRVQGGTDRNWGFAVFLLNGYGDIGNSAVTSDGTAQDASLTVSQDSFVVVGNTEWDGPTFIGSGWTPAGQTEVESSQDGTYGRSLAYWTDQAAGTRNYGTTGSTDTSIRVLAIEVLIAESTPTVPTIVRPVQSPLQLR